MATLASIGLGILTGSGLGLLGEVAAGVKAARGVVRLVKLLEKIRPKLTKAQLRELEAASQDALTNFHGRY